MGLFILTKEGSMWILEMVTISVVGAILIIVILGSCLRLLTRDDDPGE